MSASKLKLNRLGVMGVGLIGGSLAVAAKRRGLVREVIGIGRNLNRLKEAQRSGIIDSFSEDCSALAGADLAVVCTPVHRIAENVSQICAATDDRTLVTDVGSIKGAIARSLSEYPVARKRFVGAHPLAGSHQTGFEHADSNLFSGRLCILTPDEQANPESVQRVGQFWEAIGMRVREMSAEEHDRVLALTSHLPHLVAAGLAALVDEESLEFASTGFRDTTRIAASDPELWTAIFSLNSEQLDAVLGRLIESLHHIRNDLKEGREDRILEFLTLARDRRRRFQDGQPQAPIPSDSNGAEPQ